MPIISVITPVYQGKALLPDCVGSVRGQRFSDWELLLIDDGSTDGTRTLCERYAAEDSRIRFLPQPENLGVSAARNRGLQEARGRYIAFLDADDRYIPETLETLWNLCAENGADSAACAHWNVTPSGQERVETLLPSGVYGYEEIREKFAAPLFGERLRAPLMNGYIWRFLFQNDQIRQSGARFDGPYLEDELFLLEYFSAARPARRLAVTETPLYRYLQNPASATRRYMKGLVKSLDYYMDIKEELDRKYEFHTEYPDWRNNTRWANLLILIGNEYAPGIRKSFRERREDVEALCRRPDMAEAIRQYRPLGMGRNKQVVASLVRRRMFGTHTLLYRFKNRM
ncbi:MAG: glycosyltransferase [Oscillospiraceae bacterium]|nr:glycosyltransferase [Oscillospiraceae bacterium]